MLSNVRTSSINSSRSNPRRASRRRSPRRQISIVPAVPRSRRRHLDERRLAQTASLRWRAQSPFPGIEGAVFDSPIATIGCHGQPAGPLSVNDLAPFFCHREVAICSCRGRMPTAHGRKKMRFTYRTPKTQVQIGRHTKMSDRFRCEPHCREQQRKNQSRAESESVGCVM